MHGDDRVRFCDYCQLNVYNISALSRSEAESLIASTEGRLCARLFRRVDGTVLTKDCPVGLRALRMRVSKRAAAVFAAVMSLCGVAFSQHGSSKGDKTDCIPQLKISHPKTTSDPNEKALSGMVVDPMGAGIPGARVKLTNSAPPNEARETKTNDSGAFEFGSVTAGNYWLTVEYPGFKTLKTKNVVVQTDRLTNIEITLLPAGKMEFVGVLLAEPSLLDTPPGTTIITKEMIESLPH
jgi:hypothetical protein